jgi:hypothetical protein
VSDDGNNTASNGNRNGAGIAATGIATMSAAPEVTNVATSASYIENASGIVIAPSLTVSDADSSTLVAATVRISAGSFAGAGDALGSTLPSATGRSMAPTFTSATTRPTARCCFPEPTQ